MSFSIMRFLQADLLCTATGAATPVLEAFDPMSFDHGNRFDLVGHHIVVAGVTGRSTYSRISF